jgi:hypothetical protein
VDVCSDCPTVLFASVCCLPNCIICKCVLPAQLYYMQFCSSCETVLYFMLCWLHTRAQHSRGQAAHTCKSYSSAGSTHLQIIQLGRQHTLANNTVGQAAHTCKSYSWAGSTHLQIIQLGRQHTLANNTHVKSMIVQLYFNTLIAFLRSSAASNQLQHKAATVCPLMRTWLAR